MPVRSRGDTIVEVMVAFTIFAMAAVAAVAIMNRGIAMAQRSLEITLVRQQIDSQADMLRYVRDNNSPAWGQVMDAASHQPPQTNTLQACPQSTDELTGGTFYLQPSASSISSVPLRGGASHQYSPAETYARFDENRSYGMWVQPVQIDTNTYDMYINACWDTVGSDMPVMLRTIVRLYES